MIKLSNSEHLICFFEYFVINKHIEYWDTCAFFKTNMKNEKLITRLVTYTFDVEDTLALWLVSWTLGWGYTFETCPGQFMGRTLTSHSASLHPGVTIA